MSVTKDTLPELFEKMMKEASVEDIETMRAVLEGMLKKTKSETRTYINGLLKYKGEKIGEKKYSAEITLNPFVNNPLHIVHGGITATFADTAMGTLVNEVLDQAHTSVTSELKINYLKPAAGKKLYCEAEVVHKGKSLCFVTASIINDSGASIAFASGSFFVVPIPDHLLK